MMQQMLEVFYKFHSHVDSNSFGNTLYFIAEKTLLNNKILEIDTHEK